MNEQTTTKKAAVSDEIRRYQELARSVQAERLRSPLSGSGLDLRIPVKDLINRHQKELGPDWHLHTCPEKDMRAKAHAGYEPVVEDDGSLARNETDVLMKCPKWLFDQQIKANSQRNARVLSAARKKIKSDSSQKVQGVSTEFSSGMAKVGPAGGKHDDED